MMSRDQKKTYIEEMKKHFSSSEAVFMNALQRFKCKELDKIRDEMRKNDILFKITKNRITKISY